jgi:hypothetical protein
VRQELVSVEIQPFPKPGGRLITNHYSLLLYRVYQTNGISR